MEKDLGLDFDFHTSHSDSDSDLLVMTRQDSRLKVEGTWRVRLQTGLYTADYFSCE